VPARNPRPSSSTGSVTALRPRGPGLEHPPQAQGLLTRRASAQQAWGRRQSMHPHPTTSGPPPAKWSLPLLSLGLRSSPPPTSSPPSFTLCTLFPPATKPASGDPQSQGGGSPHPDHGCTAPLRLTLAASGLTLQTHQLSHRIPQGGGPSKKPQTRSLSPNWTSEVSRPKTFFSTCPSFFPAPRMPGAICRAS
jgi:hypothetical protein